MVPIPVALLTLLYGGIAAFTGAAVWKTALGASDGPVLWPLLGLAVSGALACGLPLLKAWARRMAVCASLLMIVFTLSLAALLILRGRPLAALAATFGAGVHAVIIRYLRRPVVKTLFEASITEGAS